MAQVLRYVPEVDDARVLADAATRDDAAVFQLADDRALVATVDFFTPIVDDPYTFGAIAAANAFSDVYAMGATPLLALNLVAWPRDPEILALLPETVRGAADVASEAGALILGGHSIDDPEPKFGMVALGEVHPAKITTVGGAQPGHRIVLTKPIGTGILSTALKRDALDERDLQPAVDSMVRLNRDARDAMMDVASGVHACTDVTGFGLLGHLHNVLLASACGARIESTAVPLLPRARELAAAGNVPGGTTRNLSDAETFTRWTRNIDATMKTLLADAQTSGGLLIAVSPESVDRLTAGLRARDVTAAVIGTMTDEPAGQIEVA